MRGLRFRGFLILAVAFVVAAAGHAAALRSSMGNQRNAVMEYAGFFLNPVGAEPQGDGDLAPPQLFEIVRPGNQAIQLGRLYTSCVCVALEADKASFAEGERAVVRLRNVRLSPPQGQLYVIYVQVRSPVRTVLRADTFMQSTEFLPSKPGEAPTRGDIVADGVMPEEPIVSTVVGEDEDEEAGVAAGAAEKLMGADGIEIIVPKADNYIPDTSEYTLRKKAEAEAAAEAESAEAGVENSEKKGE